MTPFQHMSLQGRALSFKERTTRSMDEHEAKRIGAREFARVLGDRVPIATRWSDYIRAVILARMDQDTDSIY